MRRSKHKTIGFTTDFFNTIGYERLLRSISGFGNRYGPRKVSNGPGTEVRAKTVYGGTADVAVLAVICSELKTAISAL